LLRRPLAAALRPLHVGPAIALALVLLPVAALVFPVNVSILAGVHVGAARALGERGVADLRGLQVVAARTADRSALAAPAVVAVVDVDVGVMADVDAAAATVAAGAIPAAAAHGEAEEQADGEACAIAVRVIRRRIVVVRTDVRRVVIAGAV